MTLENHTYNYWIINNPILGANQMGFISDLGLWKIGDGVNGFNLLPYQNQPPILSWFSLFQPIHNKGAGMTPLAQNPILVGMLNQQGSWAKFKYIINTADNAVDKEIQLLLAGQSIYDFKSAFQNLTIWLEGSIICLDYNNGTVGVEFVYKDSGGAESKSYKTYTGLNFETTLNLILQAQAVQNYDIELEIGTGFYCSIALPNPLL